MSETSDIDADTLAALSKDWAPESRAAMLDYLKAAQARELIRKRYSNVAELAAALNPNFVVTDAIDLVARKIEIALTKPRRNLAISAPPQEMKSTLAAIHTPLRAWQLNPNTKIILCTFAESLALDHSRACRELVRRHGTGVIDPTTGVAVDDKLGFALNPTNSKVDSWKINHGRGGLVAVGLHGTVIGRSADLLIIDDPYKDMVEADSPAGREKVNSWMRSVARTRLSPSASIILIQSRWHPDDLLGEIIASEKRVAPEFRNWHHVNIPAIAEEGIPDSLGRKPGVALTSALGRTKAEYEATRRDVGERVWYAMYQGSPRNPAGGLFARDWFRTHFEVPSEPVAAIVGIDPADTGKGDETGIVGGYLLPDGRICLAEDWSGKYTSEQWGRRAIELALTMNAREIAMEAYTAATTYEQVLKRAWKVIHHEAVGRFESHLPLDELQRRALSPTMPFTIFKWRGRAKADAVARSALLRQALETGTTKTAPHTMAIFESQAADWQSGQHQPDRVAAGVICHDRLVGLGSGQIIAASPLAHKAAGMAPAWMRRKLGDKF
jgi:hypothetical protein